MGIPLLQGREFRRSDAETANNQRIVVLDELAAKRLWPDGKAVGQELLLDALDRSSAQVVGIVGDVQENALREGLQPHVCIPFGQEYQSDMTLHVKAESQDEPKYISTVSRFYKRETQEKHFTRDGKERLGSLHNVPLIMLRFSS